MRICVYECILFLRSEGIECYLIFGWVGQCVCVCLDLDVGRAN